MNILPTASSTKHKVKLFSISTGDEEPKIVALLEILLHQRSYFRSYFRRS
jgi:hypothetical protein